MISIDDFTFEDNDDITFLTLDEPIALEEDLDINTCMLMLCLAAKSVDVIGLLISLDGTKTIFSPYDRDEEYSEDMTFDIVTTKSDIENVCGCFSDRINEEGYEHVAIIQQVEENKFVAIHPDFECDDEEDIDYDKMMSIVYELIAESKRLNVSVDDYFYKRILVEDKEFKNKVEYLLDLSEFCEEIECVAILAILLERFKEGYITEDQFIYYLIDGPDNIISEIKNKITA